MTNWWTTCRKKVDIRTVNMDYGVVNVIGRDTALVVGRHRRPSWPSVRAPARRVGRSPWPAKPNRSGSTAGSLGGQLKRGEPGHPGHPRPAGHPGDRTRPPGGQVPGHRPRAGRPDHQSVGTRPVTDPTQPLAAQNLPIPLTNGTLHVQPDQHRHPGPHDRRYQHRPDHESLNDVAAAITAGTGGQVQAPWTRRRTCCGCRPNRGSRSTSPAARTARRRRCSPPPTVADTDTGRGARRPSA